jgi:hypothetical protein
MTRNEDIPLRETPANRCEQEPYDTERDAFNLHHADSRQWESNRKRTCVLLGSTILQLPIWGRLSVSPTY